MTRQRVIIVDDHPLFRDALKLALAESFPAMTIVEAGSLDQLAAILEIDSDCDMVCLDLKMPGVQGFSGLVYLRAQYPAVPVVVVSGNEEPHIIRRALDLGASGFVPKSTSAAAMRKAFETVLGGEIYAPATAAAAPDSEAADLVRRLASLTPQQVRVLMMLREGLLNKQIAYQLGVSEATVKAHVSAVLLKLDVGSRTQAVIAAAKIDGEPAPETMT